MTSFLKTFLTLATIPLVVQTSAAQDVDAPVFKTPGQVCDDPTVRGNYGLIIENFQERNSLWQETWITYKCNGDVYVGVIEPGDSACPSTLCERLLGTLPPQDDPVHIELDVLETTESGGQVWIVRERLPDGTVVAETQRHADGRLTYRLRSDATERMEPDSSDHQPDLPDESPAGKID